MSVWQKCLHHFGQAAALVEEWQAGHTAWVQLLATFANISARLPQLSSAASFETFAADPSVLQHTVFAKQLRDAEDVLQRLTAQGCGAMLPQPYMPHATDNEALACSLRKGASMHRQQHMAATAYSSILSAVCAL